MQTDKEDHTTPPAEPEYNVTLYGITFKEYTDGDTYKEHGYQKGIAVFKDAVLLRGGDTVMILNNDGISNHRIIKDHNVRARPALDTNPH